MPKSVTMPFVISELTEEEHGLLFGHALKNTSLPENSDDLSKGSGSQLKKRKSSIKLPSRVSQVEDEEAAVDQDCKFINEYLVIKHNNTCKSWWDVFILIMIGYSCVVSTYS